MDKSFAIDFVGIGASKAGTTWLGYILAAHPQICLSEPKEVHFFNDRIAFRHPILKPNFAKGLSWYRQYFKHAKRGQLIGEITPRYCSDPVVPSRLYEHNPEMRILYCIREPVSRIESQYNFYKHFVGIEDRATDVAIREEPEYIEMSSYAKDLKAYREVFPAAQIHLIWFEDIQHNPALVAKQVYSFLGVEENFLPASLFEKQNPGRKSRFTALQFIIRKVSYALVAMGFSGMLHRLKKTKIKKWVMKFNSRPYTRDSFSPETISYIRNMLREDMTALEQMTSRDLKHWQA